MKFLTYSFLIAACGLTSQNVFGQTTPPRKDTLGGQVIIEKEYTPFLEDGKKQSFQPVLPKVNKTATDNNLNYTVPSQFIESSYALDELKPLPIDIDDSVERTTMYLKAGYGNMKNPLAQFAISGAKPQDYTAGILGNFSSLTGKEFSDQKMTDGNVQVFGTKELNKAGLKGQIRYDHNSDHLYGYDHTAYTLSTDDVRQTFQQVGLSTGIESINNDIDAFQYDFNVGGDILSDKLFDIEENQMNSDIKVSKRIFENLGIELLADGTYRTTKFEQSNNAKITAHNVNATPILKPEFNGLELELGASLNHDTQNEFKVFPHASIAYSFSDDHYTVYAGWKGRTENLGIQQLKEINTRFNGNQRPHNYTKQVITPFGLKGALNPNFSFNVAVEHSIAKNTQLFAIDASTELVGNSFQLLEEEQLSTTTPRLQLNYQLGDKVNALANFQYNIYKTETLPEAYQLPEIVTDLTIELQPINKLQFDIGTDVLTGIQTLSGKELDTILNVEAGAEYTITDNIGVFIEGSNLANQQYQTWENYQVAGLNFLGGVVLVF